MTAFVRFVKTLAPGLVVLEFEGNGALWSRSRIRIAGKTCAVSGRPLAVGDLAYRPVGNQMYRMERIAAEVVEGSN